MKNLQLVDTKAAAGDVLDQASLQTPKHFKALQKAAWEDLVGSVEVSLRIASNRFEFEMAAVLLAKFRSGKAMNATETKELKRQLVFFGLSKDEDGGKKKPKKNAKYFGDPAADD